MKLSEAIRAGAVIRPKRIGRMFGFTDQSYGSCALGAAFEACTGGMHFSEHHILEFLRLKFPIVNERVPHPVYDGDFLWYVSGAIQDLNDCCGWSREAIAEWVEVIEKKHEEAKAEAVEAVPVLPAQSDVVRGDAVEDVRPVLRTMTV